MTDILKESGVQEVLLLLLEHNEFSTGELMEALRKEGVSKWRFSIIKPQILNAGLIQERKEGINRKILSLTKKGKEVALALKKAREALEK